jgi:two-component system, cell cycle sensor histidine kinase and response regulator CckA
LEEQFVPLVLGKGESIVLVDDEGLLTEMNRQRLERLGYRVEARTSSAAAIEAFGTAPERFDRVITDYTVPHMTGLDLPEKLLRLRPDVPVIMCSGLNEPVPKDRESDEEAP